MRKSMIKKMTLGGPLIALLLLAGAGTPLRANEIKIRYSSQGSCAVPPEWLCITILPDQPNPFPTGGTWTVTAQLPGNPTQVGTVTGNTVSFPVAGSNLFPFASPGPKLTITDVPPGGSATPDLTWVVDIDRSSAFTLGEWKSEGETIPEPSTLVMLASGLLAVMALTMRKPIVRRATRTQCFRTAYH